MTVITYIQCTHVSKQQKKDEIKNEIHQETKGMWLTCNVTATV